MPTAYSRVTVVNGPRRVDLALPSALPIADVLPQLLRFCAPREHPERPDAWTVGRVGGVNIGLDETLEAAGVVDGDVLELRSRSVTTYPAYVEDVRDAVEDTVDETGWLWRTPTTLGFAFTAAGAGLVLAVLIPEARQTGRAGPLLSALLAATLTLAGGWWAGRRRQPRVGGFLLAVGALWGGVAGWLAASWLGWQPLTGYTAALVGALAVTVAARIVEPAATTQLALLATVTAAGVAVAVTAAAGRPPLRAVEVLSVLAVVAVGVLPRVSLSVGGLASADYQVRNAGTLSYAELSARVRQSMALLGGAVFGVSAVGLAAGVWLAYATAEWDRWLALGVGAALVLRSRVFSRVEHMLPLRLAGIAVTVTLALRQAFDRPGLRPWLVVVIAALGTALVLVSAIPLSDVTRARVRRMWNWAELGVISVLLVLAAGALGVYDLASELAN